MRKIVIVEDQAVLASIYKNKLASAGFLVAAAPDGPSGLELINRTKPDLVLLDLLLPNLNGIEVLKRVRANPLLRNVPVIIFSMSSHAELVEEAWNAGATMVLSKINHSPQMVVEAIRSALSQATVPDLAS